MLIVCPSCASAYTIDADRLGSSRRRVRCAACRVEWLVEPETPPSSAVAHHVTESAAAREPAIAVAAQSQHTARALQPMLVRHHRGRHRRRLASFVRSLIGLVGRASPIAATAVCLIALSAAVLGRNTVVKHWPETALLYAAAALPVNVRGLAFGSVRSELVEEEGGNPILVVEGEVRNVTGRALAVPRLMLDVLGRSGQPLYSWTIDPSRAQLDPQDTLAFRSRLAAPPADARDVLVRFADRERSAVAEVTR